MGGGEYAGEEVRREKRLYLEGGVAQRKRSGLISQHSYTEEMGRCLSISNRETVPSQARIQKLDKLRKRWGSSKPSGGKGGKKGVLVYKKKREKCPRRGKGVRSLKQEKGRGESDLPYAERTDGN